MNGQDSLESSLKQLVREARAEKVPELDWQALEDRLVRHAQRSVPPPARKSYPLYPLAWAALGVAAVVALWLVSDRAKVSRPQAPPEMVEATEPLRKKGGTLAVGSRVSAGERQVSVEHAGRATWTVDAHSRALLAEKDERITVRLERGSVLAAVVPNSKPETFVVEAAGTRIAVHGTVFRVELDGERVIVQVREGTVAVGPRGAVPTFFLKAPAHGDFSADGRSGNIDGRPLGESAERRAEPLRLAPVRSAMPPPSSAAPVASVTELQSEPSINDIETGIARIVDAAADCFSRNTKSTEGVQITVRTALSLQITSAGSVAELDFQPPLSPDVEQCATGSISQVTFSPSKQGAKVTRMLELKR
jgi:ferric-dicitrate binding protein FerR (iron transport regulator)